MGSGFQIRPHSVILVIYHTISLAHTSLHTIYHPIVILHTIIMVNTIHHASLAPSRFGIVPLLTSIHHSIVVAFHTIFRTILVLLHPHSLGSRSCLLQPHVQIFILLSSFFS